MDVDGQECGPLYDLYAAARAGDETRLESAWDDIDLAVPDEHYPADQLESAIDDGDVVTVEALTADLLFVDEETTEIDGPIATLVSAILYGFGYIASFVLFFGARSRTEVVTRLRWAYRRVGVSIQDTESVDGTERTTFRCPYRTVGAGKYGERRVCHDVLDRVDDGYVKFLAHHRGLDYTRPRKCTGSPCCHSEVREL